MINRGTSLTGALSQSFVVSVQANYVVLHTHSADITTIVCSIPMDPRGPCHEIQDRCPAYGEFQTSVQELVIDMYSANIC